MTNSAGSPHAKSLPSNPSLVQLKKQAKDILKAHKAGDMSVCSVLRYLKTFAKQSEPEMLESKLSLQEAQRALALDYGCRDWVDLKMRAEGNQGIVRAWVKAVNEMSDVDAFLNRYLAPQYIIHVDGREVPLSEAREYLIRGKKLAKLYVKTKASIQEMSSEGDRVKFTLRLDARARISGLPVGKKETLVFVAEIRCKDGRIVEEWIHRSGFPQGAFPPIPDIDTAEGKSHLSGLFYQRKYLKLSFQWASKAADEGYPPAFLQLANCCYAGLGVKKNLKEADRLYRRAAELGVAGGQRGVEQIRVQREMETNKGLSEWANNLPDSPFGFDLPILRFVNDIVLQAIRHNATGIDIRPQADKLRIQYEVDGVLREVDSAPARLAASVMAVIRERSQMHHPDREPLSEGTMGFVVDSNHYGVKAVFSPSEFGESVQLNIEKE